MKIFVAIALLIATVAALPLETAERKTEAVAAQPEGVASDILSGIAADIAAIDTMNLLTVAGKVGDFEGTAPGAIVGLQAALDILL